MQNEEIKPLPLPRETFFRAKIPTAIKKAVERSGYTYQEALEMFPTLIQHNGASTKELSELKETLASVLRTHNDCVAETVSTAKINRKLRKAIMVLHPSDYWEVIKRAERGYYEFVDDEKSQMRLS